MIQTRTEQDVISSVNSLKYKIAFGSRATVWTKCEQSAADPTTPTSSLHSLRQLVRRT